MRNSLGSDRHHLQQIAQRAMLDHGFLPKFEAPVLTEVRAGEYVVGVPGQASNGHFGLAVTAYTHATAPNRRFPDLVTQRLLKDAMAGSPSPYPLGELQRLAQHCTEQEDNAKKVERQVHKSAAALLLAHRVGDQFDSIVTGASEKGTWVRIVAPAVEGKVVRGFRGLDVGVRVRVTLIDTDVERGFIDFACVEGSPHAAGGSRPGR